MLRVSGIAGLAAAARAGIGLAVLPLFVGDCDPELVRVSGSGEVVTREAWLVVHRDTRTNVRIRTVIDWIVEVFAASLPSLRQDDDVRKDERASPAFSMTTRTLAPGG